MNTPPRSKDETRRIEYELRRNESRLRDFAEAGSDWFFEMDAELRFTYVSERHQDIIGVSPEQVIGKTRWDAHRDRRLTKEEDKWRRHAATMKAHKSWKDFTYTLIRDDGERRVISNSAKAIFDDDGTFLGYRGVGSDVTGRVDAETRLQSVLDVLPDAVVTIDEDGIIASFSPAAEKLFGYSAVEIIGQNVKKLMPCPYKDEHDGYLEHYRATGEKKIIGIGRKVEAERKDGSVFPIRLAVNEMMVSGKRMFTGLVHDITEAEQKEAQLRQSQKLESIGQLTGGIAHDFNNLLTVILGNNELLAMRLSEDEQSHKLLSEATGAAEQAAQLTGQLLAFARQQKLEPKAININELVIGMQDLLTRTIGETITLTTQLATGLGQTYADPVQVQNVLLNLVINARDAMPDGGAITIETSNVDLDEEAANTRPDATVGHYVRLSVSDTGTGMSPELQTRILEPFFTTKEQGKGTGLGLSMAHGFAKQSEGHLDIYSELGIGTVISVYLPDANVDAAAAAENLTRECSDDAHGETILVVEDDPRVRSVTLNRLKHLGYHVLEAENGPDALALLANNDAVDVVLTDMVMPGGLTGTELVQEVRRNHPQIAVILSSGYTENGVLPNDDLPWLQKPYSLNELATAIRSVLDET